MSLSKKEQEFINSIKNKIKKYNIRTTLKECINDYMSEVQVYTQYNNGETEVVDSGIEYFLVKHSFSYFLNRYCYVDIPGLGTVGMFPYYFQSELAKEINDYRKIVLDKTRQCLTESCYVMTNRGYISIKDVEIGDMIETLVDGKSVFVLVENWINQGEKEVCRILTDFGLELKLTLDHEVLTKEGWKEAQNLSLTDEIISYHSPKKIKKIEYLKEKETVYDITTSSGDFLANGLMVHNCGMSTIFSLYAFWKANFYPAEMIDVVSTKQSKAQLFVKKIHSTLERLPGWMKTPVKHQNQQKIVFQHAGGTVSEILSESQSDNAGRGDSLSLLILDECAHYQSENMIRQIVASAQPTLSKTGGAVILISTPNGVSGKGSYYYEQVMAAKMGEKGTKYIEIDWWMIPDDERIPGPKKGYNDILEKSIEEDYYHNKNVLKKYKNYFDPISRDLFKDNEWLRTSYDTLGASSYRQEVLHDFIISGSKVFSEEILKRFEEKLKEPIKKDILGTEQFEGLWFWKEPIPKHRYILSIDIATGTSREKSAIEVLDVENYEQVCEYNGFISTPNFSRLIKKLAKYYNEGYVIIESNSIGESVFNGVYYNENDPYSNVYRQTKTKNGITRQTGWITDTKTRQLIVNDFIDWFTVDDLFDTLKVYSKRLWLEMTTWIWEGGNKATHAGGAFDDLIMSFAIGMYNRNKAVKSGESFLITDGGEIISADSESKEGEREITQEEVENKFLMALSDEETDDDDLFKGMNKDDYNWLIGR